MKPAVLFDLDETLMVEEPAAEAAFLATAKVATGSYDVDPVALAAGARTRAKELWYAAPTHDYCMRVGISSWEGLWCRFQGDGTETQSLRAWSPIYRRESWRLALADQDVDDPVLGEELGERFGRERRARHEVFADVIEVLDRLGQSHAMALVTNGAACLQREKLAASGLDRYFQAVVVSADIGAAKPDACVFEHAQSMLGADRKHAVMVGDSVSKDIDGALGLGLGAVWVNRDQGSAPLNRIDLVEVTTLAELPTLMARTVKGSARTTRKGSRRAHRDTTVATPPDADGRSG